MYSSFHTRLYVFVESFTDENFPLFLSVSFDRGLLSCDFFPDLASITMTRHWATNQVAQQSH